MIRLKGPHEMDPGSTVCVTATNVGPGFSALGETGNSIMKLKITINPSAHTAKISFTAPAARQVIAIHATDARSGRGTIHVAIST